MSTINDPVYRISAGPSKFDLMMSIFGEKPVLEFTFDGPTDTTNPLHSAICVQTIKIRILTVSREDGSGESWNFEGKISGNDQPVKGYYHTRNRRGHLSFPANKTDVHEVTFGGNIIFGFSGFLCLKGNYIAMLNKDQGTMMVLGQNAVIRGDSKGYVPSGHKNGQLVTVVGFKMPFHRGESDCIVKVISDDGKFGSVKPSNLEVIK